MTTMENKTKSIIASTLIAGALLATTTSNANPFHYNMLGSGEEVRAHLLTREGSVKNLELKCGEKGKMDSTSTAKKGKDGKCGEGKCGEKKGKNGAKAKKKGN